MSLETAKLSRESTLEKYKEVDMDQLVYKTYELNKAVGSISNTYSDIKAESSSKKPTVFCKDFNNVLRKKSDVSKALNIKIVPAHQKHKSLVATPSQLVNLDYKTRTCKCPQIMVFEPSYFDQMIFLGVAQLHELMVEFVYNSDELLSNLVDFRKNKFCCSGYKWIFIDFNTIKDFKSIYQIIEMKKSSRISEDLKIYFMYQTLSDEDKKELNDIGFDQFFKKPIKFKELEECFQISC